MTRVVLLTNVFPYARGEEYLEAEVVHLAAAADELVVVPLMVPEGVRPTREVPAGVRVVNPGAGGPLSGRARDVVGQLARRRVGPRLGHLAPQDRPLRPDRVAYELYFESRAQAALEACERHGVLDLLTPGTVLYPYWFYLTARLAVLLRARSGQDLPVVSRGHGYDVNESASPVGYLPQRRTLLEAVDRLHPVADVTTQRLRTAYPDLAERVSTRRLGSPDPGVTSPVLRRDPFHLVSTATVRPLKRLDLLVEGLALAQGQGVPVVWTHLGTGRASAVRQLRELAGRRLAPGTWSMPGALPHSAVLPWYVQHRPTGLISCSSSEGVPVSVMEALSVGLPVVATDVGGTREVLARQPVPALLPADPTPHQVAEAVVALADLTEEQLVTIGAANQRGWREDWAADRLFADFAADLVALSGGPG